MANNKQKYGIIVLLILLIFTSCEEIIEIDLNSADPVIVAEGYMEQDSVCSLKLSYTSDYFVSEPSRVIEDATVTVEAQDGLVDDLDYMGNGIYLGQSLRGVIHTDYTLHIAIKDRDFTGSSSLMSPAEILSIDYEEVAFDAFSSNTEPPFDLTITFNDHSEEKDNYMLKFIRNGEPYGTSYNIVTEGYQILSGTLQYNSMMLQFYKGDTVSISVYSVDEDTYRYYSQVNDVIGGGMTTSSTPYNPASNLGEDLLGYFMACSRIDTTIVLK